MNYFEIKYCFYILLGITIMCYFISDILKYQLMNHVDKISTYIKENNIFEIQFVELAYNEFKNNPTVKNYIDNYNYISLKKENSTLSKAEDKIYKTLKKDIELLQISFLTYIVLDNEEKFDIILTQYIKKFIFTIKKAQILKFFKIILTIPCIVLFIKLVF